MTEPMDRLTGLCLLFDIEKARWEALVPRLDDHKKRLQAFVEEGTQLNAEARECTDTMRGLTDQMRQITHLPRPT